jgi:tetratricopeptide (TPR) repeat protein
MGNVPEREKTASVSPLWRVFINLILIVALSSGTAAFVGGRYFWNEQDFKRINKEIAYYQQLTEAEPTEPEHRVNLGYTFLRKGDYERALVQLDAAREFDENYMPAYLNAGYVYQAMELWDEALEQFQKVTELAPDDYRGFFNMGVCFTSLGKYEDALDMYFTAKLLRPGASDVAFYTAMTYEKMGSVEAAIEEYQEALTFNPKYIEAQLAIERLSKATQ